MSNHNQGIPGIPIGALDAISDENTRSVLRALVDGWNVRNSAAGSGDNAFITKSELEKYQANSNEEIKTIIHQAQTNAQYSNENLIPPGEIDRILGDLQVQILNSDLFKELGEAIELINKPDGIFDRLGHVEIVLSDETNSRINGDTALQTSISQLGVRVGNSETAIQTEINQRVSADNSLTEYVNTQYSSVNSSMALIQSKHTTLSNNYSSLTSKVDTLQASAGSFAASLQTEENVRADADGRLFAQHTIKIDLNGNISGYGLAATSATDVSSQFLVRADRFAIVSPSYKKTDPFYSERISTPFVVTTTPQVMNGKIQPPGVFMNNAIIMNGSITNAKIGNASVDTLEIAGQAVTVPLFAKNTFNTAIGANTFPYKFLEVVGNFSAYTEAMALMQVRASNGGAATNVRIRLLMDNYLVLHDKAFSQTASWTTSHVTIEGFAIQPGQHSFQLQIGNNYGSGSWTLSDISLLILGVKR